MLRNQLVHGGAWGSSINRDQVRDAVNLMGHLVPYLISGMVQAIARDTIKKDDFTGVPGKSNGLIGSNLKFR